MSVFDLIIYSKQRGLGITSQRLPNHFGWNIDIQELVKIV